MKKRAWLCLLLGAMAFTLSSGRWNVPIMAWIWPFGFLSFLRIDQRKSAPLLLGSVMLLLSIVRYYGALACGAILEHVFGLLEGFLLFLPFMADRWLFKRLHGIARTLVLPAAFTASEVLQTFLPTGVFGTIAATQTDFRALIQLASVFGSYGVSFLVIWFAPVLYEVSTGVSLETSLKSAWIKVRKPAICYLSLFVLALSLGGMRLAFAPVASPSIKVAMTTGPFVGNVENFYQLDLLKNSQSLTESVKTASSGGSDLLVLCEEAFCLPASDEQTFLHTASTLAKEYALPMVIGLETEPSDINQMRENKLVYIDAQGKTYAAYHKYKLIPFMEDDYIKGDGQIPACTLQTAEGVSATLSPIICFDSDFPGYVRDALPKKTDLLVIPTWDWAAIRAYHTKWVEYRAVENGISLVRSTYDGISTATDAYGRVLFYSDTARSGFENVVFTDVPLKRAFAPYRFIGAYLDWLYAAVFAGLVLSGIVHKRKA